MNTEQFSNNAQTTLDGSINNSATSIDVDSATGFPSAPNFRILIESELMVVTAVSGATWTVVRGAESTTAASHADGVNVTQVLTAASVQNVGLKKPARVATVAVLPNSPTYSGSTKQLTAGSNGALTVDGVSVALGDRVLVKNQASGSQNGIYAVIATGDGSNPYILERDADFWVSADVVPSLLVAVSEGSINTDSLWSLTTDAPITLDTTALVFGPVAGGGSVTSAYASRPAAGTEGRLFLPSDGFFLERDSASAWFPWGPLYPMTPPVDGDFSWVNQDTATVSTSNGGIYLVNATSNGGVVGLNMRVKSKTGTWTLTAGFLPNHGAATIADCGILARESGTGKVATMRLRNDSGGAIDVLRYASPTSVAGTIHSAVACAHLWAGGVAWQRIQNDGTNMRFFVSTDGQNFHQIATVALTTPFTTNSDQIGFQVEPFGAAAGMTLLSWVESA